MGLNPSELPDRLKRLMSPKDRRAILGDFHQTAAEQNAHNAQKLREEKEALIQSEIRRFLRNSRIPFICPDMRRKSPLPPGWPDFTLAYCGIPLAVEIKIPGEKPRPIQEMVHEELRCCGWRVEIALSLADFQDILRSIDKQISSFSPVGAPAPTDSGGGR